ncbi:MAG: MBOAT family protein [Dorea sp.]|nr:MBOAT family protein [Dorea sp.]
MIFNSIDFMLFFPMVIVVYFFIPKRIRYIWLLIASYYFYMCWNIKYAFLIALSTVITYISGLFIEKYFFRKKLILIFSLVSNLSILFVFKYFQFLLQNINHLRDIIGIAPMEKSLDLLLPVGISFYTFQALGYSIDVYRGDVKAEKNLLKYALFVSFFPQLVAGPIERSKNLLTQVNCVEYFRLWNYERITNGAVIMLWGFFQKMVIADRAAILVDKVYGEYWIYGTIELIFATILFAFQIYCDFSGYSMIAVGAARIMGFELMENFNAPYYSKSIKEFWRRWHISLSSWFRDYIYIPLGGNRVSRLKGYGNLMVTFLISGLWHGANWSYVAWGGVHGVYQIVGSLVAPIRDRLESRLSMKKESMSYKLGQVIVTFILVDFAWIFFRADRFLDSISIISQIFTRWNPWILFDGSLYSLGLDIAEMHILVVSILMLLLVDMVRYRTGKIITEYLKEQCLWFRWLTIIALFWGVTIYGVYGSGFSAVSFIYFQF